MTTTAHRAAPAPLLGLGRWLAAAIAAAILYGTAGGASPARAAEPSSPALLAELRALTVGEMSGLSVHETPITTPLVQFFAEDGGALSLQAFRGKVVLLNFWATWCGPCRKEMPEINALAAELGGPDFTVVTVSLDRGGPKRPKAFFDKIGANALTLYQAPKMGLSKSMGVKGLPVTAILDRSGHEIARITGAADWSSEDAKRFIARLIADQQTPG